ncbi:MAG: CehA/McbA family metallohydrolase, partial [Bryobacteraceae bacterium]
MGHTAHRSRREILQSISMLGSGSLLLPVGVLRGQKPDTRTPGVIRGELRDGATGQPVAAKIRVVNTASNEVYMPVGAIKTMPQRAASNVRHYFYARGKYEVAVPPGRYQIEVVRGISHDAAIDYTEVGSGLTNVVDFRIPVLKDLHASGWYSGNTHTHYHLEIDEDPDDRLRMVPPAEALDVSVISYLIRGDSPYITNRYPIGRLPQFSRDGTIMDMGEEARNNRAFTDFGYGHCLFLNIPRAVEPVSTGLLAKGRNVPDFPALSMLAAEARSIGGTVVWCHNGSGMESPVAAALGHMDAYNLGDGLDADYARYYQLLNCGLRIPASSGTDWWIYDHNRVFVQVEGGFTYDTWIAGLRAGRTFISNGPLLELRVNGRTPGGSVKTSGGPLKVSAQVISRLPFERVEIVYNGEVVAEQASWKGREAKLEREIAVDRGGWVAARVAGVSKTHAAFTVFAHTSPVYVEVEGTPRVRSEAAGAFVDEIGDSIRFIRKSYRFAKDADRALALGRFEEALRVYGKLAGG